MINKDNKLFSGLKNVLDANAPTLCTFGSIIGVGLTIYFMHRASKQAALVEAKCDEELKAKEQEIEVTEMPEDEAKSERTRLKMNKYLQLIYIYRWALLSGIGSAGFAVLSNYLNGRTIAAMTTMLALNQEKLKKGAEKVKAAIGEEKFQKIQDDINREILGEKMTSGKLKTEISNKTINDELNPDEKFERYFDTFWGQPIEIYPGVLKDAIASASNQVYMTWNDWRNLLGLDSCKAGYNYEWNNRNRFKVRIGWIDMGPYGCKTLVYENEPEMVLNQR